MRVLVCGSRDWSDRGPIRADMLHTLLVCARIGEPLALCHGGARGADSIAQEWAAENLDPSDIHAYPVTPEEWATIGKKAGPLRNQRMLDEFKPDLVFAYRSPGRSPGTDHMVRIARAAGVGVRLVAHHANGRLSLIHI